MDEGNASFFACPVCGKRLFKYAATLKCAAGHSFDVSKRGYVNLLLNSGPAGKRHGDDAMMARARTEFLEKGYYDPLARALCEELMAHVPVGSRVLDCGCGECFYTGRAAETLPGCAFGGIDISRAVIDEGAKRRARAELAVASAFTLPVEDASCGAVINLFAPLAEQEFSRVLVPGGVLLRAVPTEKHLWELKCSVYDQPYENKPTPNGISGFELLGVKRIEYSILLDDKRDIDALFRMTPYYYKTSKSDQEKLFGLQKLETQVGFELLTYRRPE